MLSYIIRRLLLIIPTMLGITFIVFMLVAYSPGGVGAALQAQSGGQMEQSDRARQEAYLEERYGLNDPPPVQYLRWLGRVSPIKFGARAQVKPDGEVVNPPQALRPPIMAGEWYATGARPAVEGVPTHVFESVEVAVPEPSADEGTGPGVLRRMLSDGAEVSSGRLLAEVVREGGSTAIRAARAGVVEFSAEEGASVGAGDVVGVVRESKSGTYGAANDRFARARAAYIAARAQLEDAIRAYADVGARAIRESDQAQRRLRAGEGQGWRPGAVG